MPLPSGLKIEPAKVILFLKLKLTDLPLFYSPPWEGSPPNVINLNNNPMILSFRRRRNLNKREQHKEIPPSSE